MTWEELVSSDYNALRFKVQYNGVVTSDGDYKIYGGPSVSSSVDDLIVPEYTYTLALR